LPYLLIGYSPRGREIGHYACVVDESRGNRAASRLSESEWQKLVRACAEVPSPSTLPDQWGEDGYPDYVTNLMLTVLDLQLRNVIVNNAIEHYRRHCWDQVRHLDDLEEFLSDYADDADGNRAAAFALWGYRYGDRLHRLRDLTIWARRLGLVDQEQLRNWAHRSDFRRDFEGQTKGLGIAAYCWLVMRLGVDTVKPDVWTHRFVKKTLGRTVDDVALVEIITAAARQVGRSPREVDAGIWESGRGDPGAI
jgi:hypothetical protein